MTNYSTVLPDPVLDSSSAGEHGARVTGVWTLVDTVLNHTGGGGPGLSSRHYDVEQHQHRAQYHRVDQQLVSPAVNHHHVNTDPMCVNVEN